jgi:hypothetical protein
LAFWDWVNLRNKGMMWVQKLMSLTCYLLSIFSVLVGIIFIGIGLSGEDSLNIGSFLGSAIILILMLFPATLFYFFGSKLRKKVIPVSNISPSNDTISPRVDDIFSPRVDNISVAHIPIQNSDRANIAKSKFKNNAYKTVELEDFVFGPEYFEGQFIAFRCYILQFNSDDLWIRIGNKFRFSESVVRIELSLKNADVEYRRLAAYSVERGQVTIYCEVIEGKLSCDLIIKR